MNNDAAPRQLSLLHHPDVPVQFRIDADTRRRGLRHIAEIRQQMEERRAERAEVDTAAERLPVRPHAA